MKWTNVSAMTGQEAGSNAAAVATVSVVCPGDIPDGNIEGPVTLQRFSDTPLFRICVHHNNSVYNRAVFCLPTDEAWTVSLPRKIKTKRSKKKALELTFNLPEENPDGFKKLVVTLPYDGEDGDAMLFCEAAAFASGVVFDYCQGREYGHG
ncbi:expressed unknown protein [Seminavis robusta]|uniref:Uncharacterized protein n=1 Tax=Seminavis robusta TaxID=568900 RepID=A0A9N8D6S3_9STRA|nr:expressed unknown protein [Seminavis robusta]|eukprot:Sro3_g002350.1 n/a (151) ;mRNA; f:125316-125768